MWRLNFIFLIRNNDLSNSVLKNIILMIMRSYVNSNNNGN